MKRAAVFSYSFSGNNDKLASSLAAALGAEHIRIAEQKKRSMASIILDMMFNRTPRITGLPEGIDSFDTRILVGPVWMGKVASPFRALCKSLRGKPGSHAFVSISGGALGPNPKLAGDLTRLLGGEPSAVIDLHIADLLPANPKPTMKMTSAYRLNDGDVSKLTEKIAPQLRKVL